jgi:hypothetical protein
MIGNPLEQDVVPGLEPLKPFVSEKPLENKINTQNKKPIEKNNNRKKPQNNKPNNKRRIRKGPHSRLEGMGLRKKHNPLRRTTTQSNDNNWQSDFVEPKERTVKMKRVVIRYKDSKKSLLK